MRHVRCDVVIPPQPLTDHVEPIAHAAGCLQAELFRIPTPAPALGGQAHLRRVNLRGGGAPGEATSNIQRRTFK